MKNLLLLLLIFIPVALSANTGEEWLFGSVSYVSTQHVYVKFESTNGIQAGDTLYTRQNNKLTPALVVVELSSISCVCNPIAGILPVSTKIEARVMRKPEKQEKPEISEEKSKESVALNDKAIQSFIAEKREKEYRQKITGRLSASSYSDFSDYNDNTRFRYNFALNAEHINNSKFSGEVNIAASHNTSDSSKLFSNIPYYLKVYSLAVRYDIDSTSSLTLGRKFNAQIANLGAIDGLQYEKTLKNNLSYGAIVGSRPNYYDYAVNPDLMEFGAYLAHQYKKGRASMRSSFGLFNQMNKFKTDRRFGYLQHSNNLFKNVDFFGSLEFDLYKLDQNSKAKNTIDLTSTYLSLRYNPWRRLSLALSYDARKNVYYYETFKNRIDSTIDKETRQGLRFRFNYRPFRFMSWGGTAGINNPNVSKNASTYLSVPNVPFIHTSLMIDATILQTPYIDGMIYGASLSRDIVPGLLFGQLSYRIVDYQFNNSASTLPQNIGEVSLSWQISKKLIFSGDYELTKESGITFNRLFLNLSQRF